MTRAEARALALTTYDTGKPCRAGHMAARYVVNGTCSVCMAARRKAVGYRGERCKPEVAARYRERHREEVRARRAAWGAAYPEREAAQRRAYRTTHPEVIRAAVLRRRARLAQAEGVFTGADLIGLYEGQRGLCAACCCDLAVSGYHADHKVPLSRGGSNWPTNIQLLCPTCNRSKGARTMEEWRP